MVPTMLNVPSLLVQLPYVILNPDKKEWVPKSMDLWTWRAITLPLIGILFWWIAGRSMEALLAARPQLVRPRIRWIEAVVGATLLLFLRIRGGWLASVLRPQRGLPFDSHCRGNGDVDAPGSNIGFGASRAVADQKANERDRDHRHVYSVGSPATLT